MKPKQATRNKKGEGDQYPRKFFLGFTTELYELCEAAAEKAGLPITHWFRSRLKRNAESELNRK